MEKITNTVSQIPVSNAEEAFDVEVYTKDWTDWTWSKNITIRISPLADISNVVQVIKSKLDSDGRLHDNSLEIRVYRPTICTSMLFDKCICLLCCPVYCCYKILTMNSHEKPGDSISHRNCYGRTLDDLLKKHRMKLRVYNSEIYDYSRPPKKPEIFRTGSQPPKLANYEATKSTQNEIYQMKTSSREENFEII